MTNHTDTGHNDAPLATLAKAFGQIEAELREASDEMTEVAILNEFRLSRKRHEEYGCDFLGLCVSDIARGLKIDVEEVERVCEKLRAKGKIIKSGSVNYGDGSVIWKSD
jgi:hypothetical protein